MKPVIVTTAHRGVFFGYLADGEDDRSKVVKLRDLRNVIKWTGTRGFLGLAESGPEPESRLGATAPEAVLQDVTSVVSCTEQAAEACKSWK